MNTDDVGFWIGISALALMAIWYAYLSSKVEAERDDWKERAKHAEERLFELRMEREALRERVAQNAAEDSTDDRD